MGSLMNGHNKREVMGLRDLRPDGEISGRLSDTQAQNGFLSVVLHKLRILRRKDTYIVPHAT